MHCDASIKAFVGNRPGGGLGGGRGYPDDRRVETSAGLDADDPAPAAPAERRGPSEGASEASEFQRRRPVSFSSSAQSQEREGEGAEVAGRRPPEGELLQLSS